MTHSGELSPLDQKTFVGALGPTASGKSTLIEAVIRLAPEFIPTGAHTTLENIDTYAIGPIDSDSIEDLATAGFKNFCPVFVVVRGDTYQERLEKERMHLPDIRSRLSDAMGSLLFARMNVEASWFDFVETGESDETLNTAADDIIRSAYHHTRSHMTTDYKLQLLEEMENAVQNVHRQLP